MAPVFPKLSPLVSSYVPHTWPGRSKGHATKSQAGHTPGARPRHKNRTLQLDQIFRKMQKLIPKKMKSRLGSWPLSHATLSSCPLFFWQFPGHKQWTCFHLNQAKALIDSKVAKDVFPHSLHIAYAGEYFLGRRYWLTQGLRSTYAAVVLTCGDPFDGLVI